MRKLGILCGVLAVLLVVAWFVLTSGAFFKGFILPRVGAAMNAEVTVAEVAISPFSQLRLTDFKVQPRGAETLFTAREIRLRYSLWSILGGRLSVQEIFVDTPAVTITQTEAGASNLDPILQAASGAPSASPSASAPPAGSATLQLDLQNIQIKNASLKQTTRFTAGGEQVLEITGGNLTLPSLKNGETAELGLEANAAFRTTRPTNSALAARLDGKLTLAIGNDGLPQSIGGGAKLAVNQATGAFAELAQAAAVLDCDMSPTEIKGIALKLQRANAELAALRLFGPFDAEKREGRLTLEAYGIDRNVLNLAGASAGLDFKDTLFVSTNRLELANAGQTLTLNGKILGARFSVTQAGATTPALDLAASYDLTVDQAKETLLLRTLELTALRGTHRLLEGSLSQPMRLEWAKGADAVDESDFKLTLTGLDLRDYGAFLGTNIQSGVLDGSLELRSRAAGKQLALAMKASGKDLAAAADGVVYGQLGFTLQSSLNVQDFARARISEGDFRLTHRGQPALHARTTGDLNLTNQNLALALEADGSLPVLAGLSPVPGTALTDGRLEFKGSVKQTNLTPAGAASPAFAQDLAGQLRVANLSGQYGDSQFDAWGAQTDFDLGMKDNLATVRKLIGALQQGGQPAGQFELQAESRLDTGAAKINLRLTGLNERALAPFLNPYLDGMSLQSVAVHAELLGGYDPKADSTLRGNATMTNLVLRGEGLPVQPLAAALALNVALREERAEFRDTMLKLTPTPRGKNEVALTGHVDFSQSDAITGALKLAADTLDLTSYYDLFLAAPETAAAPGGTPAPAEPEVEPEAILLPVKNLVTEVTCNHLYLRELDVSELKSTVTLDGGRTLIKPLQAKLNGAPASGHVDLDLGVPGWKYDVALDAKDVPIPPLISLTMPERAGQFGGTATALLNVKGAGITDASIAKHLAGDFFLGTTNLNFQPINARSSIFKTVVNVVVGIPDLIRNPTAALSSMVGRLTGSEASRTPGWVDQIMGSPVDVLVLRGTMGEGKVLVEQGTVRSPAFLAETRGEIGLAPILTNSTLNLPLQISLARGLAERVRLVPANTPTNAEFAKLPDFITLRGSAGVPRTDVNARAATALAAQAGAGLLGETGSALGGAIGSALGSVGSLLGGSGAKPAPDGTNAPAQSSGGGIGGILGGLLGGGTRSATNVPSGDTNAPPASTNAPSATTNAPSTNRPANPLDLFRRR